MVWMLDLKMMYIESKNRLCVDEQYKKVTLEAGLHLLKECFPSVSESTRHEPS